PELPGPGGYGRPHGSSGRFGRYGALAQRGKQPGTTCLPGSDATVGSTLRSIATGCVHLHRKYGLAPDASTLAGSDGRAASGTVSASQRAVRSGLRRVAQGVAPPAEVSRGD